MATTKEDTLEQSTIEINEEIEKYNNKLLSAYTLFKVLCIVFFPVVISVCIISHLIFILIETKKKRS